jgi:hypothetical protein
MPDVPVGSDVIRFGKDDVVPATTDAADGVVGIRGSEVYVSMEGRWVHVGKDFEVVGEPTYAPTVREGLYWTVVLTDSSRERLHARGLAAAQRFFGPDLDVLLYGAEVDVEVDPVRYSAKMCFVGRKKGGS